MEVFQTHVVAFVDILGFKEALLNTNKEQKILEILQKLKNGETKKSEIDIKAEGYTTSIRIKPRFTAFSDNIVLSVSEGDLKINNIVSWRQAIFAILDYVAQIANILLREGLLLRGGVTIGKLHHEDNIVFGKGYLDAYNLESEFANYPRILASPEIVAEFNKDRGGQTYERFF